MAGYTKLFSDIVDSSIWKEDSDTCKVWITLLALSDADGYVRGSVGWLADKSLVPRDLCQRAIEKFAAPDHTSRTEENDGRRIELLDDGWLILNYLSFRDRLSNDASAVASRERVRRHREHYRALRNGESVTRAGSGYASASASDETIKSEPPPADHPSAEVATTPSGQALTWAKKIIEAYGETLDNCGPVVLSKVMSNCEELIISGKDKDKFDMLCDWIQRSKNQHKPKDSISATEPLRWQRWQTMMKEEIERASRPKGRR